MTTYLVVLFLRFNFFELLSQNTVSTSLEWRIHKTLDDEVTEGEVEFRIRMYIGKIQKKLKLRGTIFYWIVQEQIAIPPLERKFVINIE